LSISTEPLLREEKTLAALAEFLQVPTVILTPLIIYVARREWRLVGFHAVQAVLAIAVVFGIGAGRGRWLADPLLGRWARRITQV
jgi:hypothetical protein